MTEELTVKPDVEKAVDSVNAVTTPETFDFALAVQDRSYPETDVPVYLDERKIQKMLALEKERDDLELRIAHSKKGTVAQANELKAIDDKYSAIVQELRDQRYLVTIKGISPEESLSLETRALEAYPRVFEETTHAMTGATVKTELDSPERDALHITLIRQAHIVKVTAPNGSIDSDFSDLEKVKATWARLPFVARAKVDQAIQESTIAVDFYRDLVDEVF